jgi:hypothetical protein
MSPRLKLHFTLYAPAEELSATPQVYHPYLILASEWQTADSGVATIVPMSSDCPTPDQVHVVVLHGGPRAAIRTARDTILSMPRNQGLSSMPHELDEFQEW